jgi:signal transduction histidine kinase
MKDALWVGPLTVFVMVGTFFAGGGHEGFTAWQWVSVALAGLACLALLLTRASPELAVLLSGLLIGLYFACGFQDGPVYLPLFLGSYVVARANPVRRWMPWFAISVGLVLVGMAIRALTTGLGWWQPLGQSIGVTALAATAATVGSLVSSRQQTERERLARVATEEQLRMAQDLHDGVGHGLAVIAMQAGVALHVLERDPASARQALEAIREASRDSLDALRAELSRLSGSAPTTPRRGLADLDVLVERVRSAGLDVDVRRSSSSSPVPPDVDAAAYAIVQESLTNVLRHASAQRVEVAVDDSDGLRLTVADDGRGGAVHDEGMGLRGMRERAEALGGTVTAGPLAEGGFEVSVVFPL